MRRSTNKHQKPFDQDNNCRMNRRAIKLVVAGDGSTGKTCLLLSYANNGFPCGYIPTVFDNYSVQITAGDEYINVTLWDTAGQDEYDRLRPLSYSNTSVFLICFSMVEPSSFENVEDKWYPEILHYCPGVPVILVGTKLDLVNDPTTLRNLNRRGLKPITEEQGIVLANRLKMLAFVPCSAFKGTNLKKVFDIAIKSIIANTTNSPQKRKKCILF